MTGGAINNAPRSTEVYYTTDVGFAIPTIASIHSLRQWRSATQTRIHTVLLGMNEQEIDAFNHAAKDLNVNIHCLTADDLAFFDKKNFNKTHVPYSTLARFLTPRFISTAPTTDILYLDGDTWFVQDPKALLDFSAPEAGLLASEDQSYFFVNDIGQTGKEVTRYLANLGVDKEIGYFNAGVIKCRSEEWVRICHDCLLYLKENLQICRFHDQSALNAVVGTKRIRLSPAWNFQTPYFGWGVSEIEAPKLLHFVGAGKPWMGIQQAWSNIYADYTRVIRCRAHPLLPLSLWNEAQQSEIARAEKWMTWKNRTIFQHRMWYRRKLFQELLDTAVL